MDSLTNDRRELETRIRNLLLLRETCKDEVRKLEKKENLLTNIALVLLTKVKPNIYYKTYKLIPISISYSIELDQFRVHAGKDDRIDGTTILDINHVLTKVPTDIEQVLNNLKKVCIEKYRHALTIRSLRQDIHRLRYDRMFKPVVKVGGSLTIDGNTKLLESYTFNKEKQILVYNFSGIEITEVIHDGIALIHNKTVIRQYK